MKNLPHTNKEGAFLLDNKSLGWFLIIQFFQLGVFFLVFSFLFPVLWERQLAAGPVTILCVFLALHLLTSFFEFFFHRYVLHLFFLKPFASFAKKHGAHHGLTPIRKIEERGVFRVTNSFPIILNAQRKHSVFPWYSLMGFAATFTPVAILLQWLLPTLPIIVGGYLAVFVSYVGYEVIHAYEHRSYEGWWKFRIAGPFGRVWEKAYSFHLTHHANTLCNEAIAGFLGLPVPDWIFGTYKKAPTLFIDGAIIDENDFAAPPAFWLIRTLDKALGVT